MVNAHSKCHGRDKRKFKWTVILLSLMEDLWGECNHTYSVSTWDHFLIPSCLSINSQWAHQGEEELFPPQTPNVVLIKSDPLSDLDFSIYCPIVCALSLSLVWLFSILCNVAWQAPLSLGFSRQEYWSKLSFPPRGDLPDLGIEPTIPALAADSLLLSHVGSPRKA